MVTQLHESLAELSQLLQADAAVRRRAQEVGALYTLWLRTEDAGHQEVQQLVDLLTAAFEGFEGASLTRLAEFGGFLTREAIHALGKIRS